MKTIIVTGGSGFIGAHLCEYLVEKYSNYQLICVDDLSGSERSNVSLLEQKGLLFSATDLRNQQQVDSFFKQYNISELYVLYLASAAHEGRSFYTPNLNMSRNDEAFRVFLTVAIKYNLKKIVVFSSMARYGDGFNGQNPPFTEDMHPYPLDPYGLSKVLMEDLTRIQSKVFGFDYTILVPHNVFGEKQCYWDPYRNVLAIWMNLLLQHKSPVIYGDGNQKRAFSYIKNCRNQMVDCLFNSATNNEIINIGGMQEYTINEAYRMVQNASGIYIDPKYHPPRPCEAKIAFCSFQKSVDLLGYKDDIWVPGGIKEMWKWLVKQGPRHFIYLDKLELTNDLTPQTWVKHLF